MGLEIKKIYLSTEDPEDNSFNHRESTDVIVLLENGIKYVASFFTYANIEEKRCQNKQSGEYLDGLYFWDKNLVLVEECTLKTIEQVIQNLMDEGEFQEAFKRL